MRKTFVILLLISIIGWVGYTFWQAYQLKPIKLQGQIEAQQYNVSSKIAGRIDSVEVKKGDLVELGQLIFSIDSPEIEAKLTQAKAGQEAAEALAEKVQNGAREQQIAVAEDQWLRAKVQTDLLDKTYKRVSALYEDGVVPEQKKDEVYAQLKAAKHARDAAFQMYSMAKDGARKEDRKAAEGQAEMAAGVVDEVEVYAADSHVYSPHSGEVTSVLLHEGELAPQGFPVATVINMADAWALFHVREDLLSHFQKDTEIEAYIPALEASYQFRVSYVSVMGEFATWRATNSETGFDMRTFEVEARPLEKIENLRAGMSVVFEVN